MTDVLIGFVIFSLFWIGLSFRALVKALKEDEMDFNPPKERWKDG